MPQTDPFPSNSVFPVQKDTFPSLVDAGSADAFSVPKAYTKMWASHHNKLVNCINNIQSELLKSKMSAQSDDSFEGLTYAYRLPPVSLSDVFRNCTPLLHQQGLFPATHIFPFEWVITSSNDDYSRMPSGERVSTGEGKMIFQRSQADMNKIFGGMNLYNIYPMVSVNLTRRNNGYTTGFSTMKWLTNCYTLTGNDTLLIRGCIIDPYATIYDESELETVGYRFDPNMQLNCTIVGVSA